MSYQILPNIIFILAVLGILLMFLRRLPEAPSEPAQQKLPEARENLSAKGLPAEAFSKVGQKLKLWIQRAWNFVLEAKDLKPSEAAGYKMKKIFGGKLPGFTKSTPLPVTTQEIKNEKYFLDQIKLQPKNFGHYDALGRYYLEKQSFTEAQDIYQYLTNHQPANPDFEARLGYCFYQMKRYDQAANHYQKSVTLDSTQPNRYYNLALSWEAAGNLPEAIKNFERAIVLEPIAKYYLGLSAAWLKLGHAAKAKEALQNAHRVDPKNTEVLAKMERVGAKK